MPFKFVFHLFTHFWSLAIKGTVPSGFAGGVKTVDKQSIFYNAPNMYRLQLTFDIFNLKKHKWLGQIAICLILCASSTQNWYHYKYCSFSLNGNCMLSYM